jgi:predicted NBD/HSP70 family sugar kinase
VSAVVEDLVASGLLQQLGTTAARRGRPPLLVAANSEFGCLAGVDIGSQSLRVALADLNGRVLERLRQPTHADSREGVLEQIEAAIVEVCAKAGQPPSKLLAIGAGVGAGIVLGGRLHRGHRWYAGEIGRMNLDRRQWQVDFGQMGYLEQHLGMTGADGWKSVFDAAARGEPTASQMVEELAVVLGTAVANTATLLDPALVVFGGGLGHAGQSLIEPVRRVVARIVPNVPAMKPSALGDDAQLMGALYSALELAEHRLAEIAAGA